MCREVSSVRMEASRLLQCACWCEVNRENTLSGLADVVREQHLFARKSRQFTMMFQLMFLSSFPSRSSSFYSLSPSCALCYLTPIKRKTKLLPYFGILEMFILSEKAL